MLQLMDCLKKGLVADVNILMQLRVERATTPLTEASVSPNERHRRGAEEVDELGILLGFAVRV